MRLFSSIGNCDGPKELYDKVGNFLQENMKTSPFLVYSYPIKEKKNVHVFRGLWNKDFVHTHYDKRTVDEMIDSIKEADIGQKRWLSRKLSSGQFYAFSCGVIDGQQQVGLFRMDGGVDYEGEVLDHLVTFVENFNSHIIQWRDRPEVKKLNALVHTDEVTGLYNQRKLHKDLKEMAERYEKFNETFAVLFVDIDFFKNVNDDYGHLVGTQLLSQLAIVLKAALREYDLLYRYGGDEFVALIPDGNRKVAQLIAERILKNVKEARFIIDDDRRHELSVSIGAASYPDDTRSCSEILSIADQMMYRAKSLGRGRACSTTDLLKKARARGNSLSLPSKAARA